MKNLFVILLTIFFFSCNSKEKGQDAAENETIQPAQEEAADRQYKVKVGDFAPDFEMELTSGEKVRLSSLRGKVVMLQFTASWCGVCRREMPYIEKEIWQKHKDNKNFALFGIDREEPLETVVSFIEKTGVTYPMGLDTDASIFTLYAEKDAGITRNVIIDKDGRIVMLTRLFEMEEFNDMTETINNLLTE